MTINVYDLPSFNAEQIKEEKENKSLSWCFSSHTQGTKKEWVERTENRGFKSKVLEILASKVVFSWVTDGLSLH